MCGTSPHIYIGVGGREAAPRGAPIRAGAALGFPSGAPPSFYGREGKERGGGAPPLPSSLSEKRQEGWRPSSFHLIGLAAIRGVHQPMWAVVFPFVWPIKPNKLPGASGTPSGAFRNHSGDQMLSSYISIFTSGPFRSSSLCL